MTGEKNYNSKKMTKYDKVEYDIFLELKYFYEIEKIRILISFYISKEYIFAMYFIY